MRSQSSRARRYAASTSVRHPLDHHEDRAHVDVDVDGQHGPLPPVRQGSSAASARSK